MPCACDLAQESLYSDPDNIIKSVNIKSVNEGIVFGQMAAGTFRETLGLLTAAIDLPRLQEGIALLNETDDLQV